MDPLQYLMAANQHQQSPGMLDQLMMGHPSPVNAPYQQGDFQRAGPQMRVTTPVDSMRDTFSMERDENGNPVAPGWGDALSKMMMVAPAGLGGRVSRGVASSPKVVGGTIAAGSTLAGTSQAGEDDFRWDDPNADRVKEMTDIQKRVNERAAKITELGTTKTKSPAGTQASTIASLEKLNGADNGRLDALRTQQTGDRDTSLKLWQEKSQSEKPFRQEWPNVYRGLPLAGWALSALGGLAGAKGGSALKSMAGGAAGGTLASAIGAVGPTAYDSATLPTGSKYQKQANDWLHDPEYYTGRVAPEVAVGMLLGALGGKWGATMKSSGTKSAAPQAGAGTPPPTTGQISPELSALASSTPKKPWMRDPGAPPERPFFDFER